MASIVLLNMGGPETLDDVRPFLLRLFSDPMLIALPGGRWVQPAFARAITAARAPRVRKLYARIGGGSPLLRLTREQARGLERALARRGKPGVRVEVAMRYAPPFAEEALARLVEAGEKRALALPLYPHECRATTGSSLADLGAARDRVAPAMTIDIVHSYHEHPGYVAALVGRIVEALDRLDEEDRAEAVLLFSAHGVPERLARRGDPYVRQIRETVDAVMHSLEGTLGRRPEHRLGFQSRVGPVRWVGPGTDEVIRSLAGRRCVLAIPVAFVSDHIETLYEIDMLFGEEARRAGIARFARVPSLNSDPAFLDALAAIAIGAFEAAEERAGARAEGGAGARAGRGGTEAREGERRR